MDHDNEDEMSDKEKFEFWKAKFDKDLEDHDNYDEEEIVYRR